MNKRLAEINFHPMKANAGAFKIWRAGVPAGPGFNNYFVFLFFLSTRSANFSWIRSSLQCTRSSLCRYGFNRLEF